MNKLFIVIVSICVLQASCTRYEKDKASREKVEEAEARRDSLENELVNTMDEINRNLDMIRQKQGLIAAAGTGEDLSKKNNILENISLINSLLEDNKKKIALLSAQSEQLGKEKSALTKIAGKTKERIERQEREIADLKQQLSMEEFKVADLNVKMDELQVANERLEAEKEELAQANAQYDKDLNKAYFVYGTYDELRAKKLIEKKGVMSGKKNSLSQSFYKNRSFFSELDIRDLKQIPVQGRKPKLLTFHPAESYQIKESGVYSSIEISDPAAFWGTSRFLVVEVR